MAGTDDCGIELTLRAEKPPVLRGEHGLSRKGAAEGNASYYYSLSRLATTGTITVKGTRFQVHGDSWMDHEFSTSFLEEGQIGWDWFAIQLDNGKELMLYQMRRTDGSRDPFSSGTFVRENGESQHLSARDFRISPAGTWRSPQTGGDYPLRWRVELPTLGFVLDVEPALEAQEMVTKATTGISYWEGSITVKGRRGQTPVRGKGYLELTGYAGRGLGSLFKD